jgi:sulfopyruvate decarboxylase subunit beta
MIVRDACLRALAAHLTDEITVSAYSTAFDWIAVRPGHALNFTSVGAMGLASSHGLGFALARPDRRVIVLDGDGSLLMNLGALVTIANAAPANLVHMVFANGTYEANGGHPTPARTRSDFAALAAAAGYRHVHSYADLESFAGAIPQILAEAGPVFVQLEVVAGEQSPRDYGVLYAESARARFRTAVRETRP